MKKLLFLLLLGLGLLSLLAAVEALRRKDGRARAVQPGKSPTLDLFELPTTSTASSSAFFLVDQLKLKFSAGTLGNALLTAANTSFEVKDGNIIQHLPYYAKNETAWTSGWGFMSPIEYEKKRRGETVTWNDQYFAATSVPFNWGKDLDPGAGFGFSPFVAAANRAISPLETKVLRSDLAPTTVYRKQGYFGFPTKSLHDSLSANNSKGKRAGFGLRIQDIFGDDGVALLNLVPLKLDGTGPATATFSF